MRLALVSLLVWLICAAGPPSVAAQRAEPPSVAVLLERVTTYLVDYAKAYAQVVAEERYQQSLLPKRVSTGLTTPERRVITSDIVAVSDSTQTWLNFRDVFAVDNVNVRDRDERLAKLFLNQSGDPLAKARVIAMEGSRFNLGTILRTINFPSMALTFLSTANQPRSTFRIVGSARVAGVETVEMSFEETARPTLVKSGTISVPMSGRFWIEPASGRVMKSNLRFDSKEFGGRVDVTYGFVEKLGLWLPVRMDDTCSGPREVVDGRATYTNFRKFGTSAVIK